MMKAQCKPIMLGGQRTKIQTLKSGQHADHRTGPTNEYVCMDFFPPVLERGIYPQSL